VPKFKWTRKQALISSWRLKTYLTPLEVNSVFLQLAFGTHSARQPGINIFQWHDDWNHHWQEQWYIHCVPEMWQNTVTEVIFCYELRMHNNSFIWDFTKDNNETHAQHSIAAISRMCLWCKVWHDSASLSQNALVNLSQIIWDTQSINK
jgi:hypothetical protein